MCPLLDTRIPACACTAILALALGGCSESSAPGVIRLGLPEAPVTLDPRRATDAVSTRICRLLYRSLVDFDARYRPVAQLATWTQVDTLRYRFVLGREGRRFHDGTMLRAADVKATYDWLLDPGNASPHFGSLKVITGVEIIDADTLDFHLSRPDPLFPGRLTHGILPAAKIYSRHPFYDQPVGSGPVRFVSRNAQGHILLQRYADGQHLLLIAAREPVTRLLKLARGELDLVQGAIPPDLLAWARRHEEINVTQRPGNVFTYLGFNLAHPVTGDPLIRRAIAHALDRRLLAERLMQGRAVPAEQLMPPGHWAGHPGLLVHGHDLEHARALVQEAGYSPDNPPRITYKTSSDPLRIRLAIAIAHQLERAGIKVAVRSLDWGVFYGDVKAGHFEMYSLSWVGLKLPDIYRYAFHSESVPPHGANRGRLTDTIVDRLIEEAEQSPATVSAGRYRTLQEHLHGILPYVPLWHEHHVLMTRTGIHGYTIDAQGSYDGLLTVEREAVPSAQASASAE